MPAKVRSSHAADVREKILSGFSSKSVKPLSAIDRIEVLPTGLDVLDRWVLGCGGLPVGRVLELFSDPDVGKTSLAMHFIAAAQRAGGVGLLIETENTIQKERAAVMGANPEEILLWEQASAEEFIVSMRIALERIPDGFGPNVLVWDSLAATSLADQLAKLSGKPASKQVLAKGIGGKARLMSAELPALAVLAREKRCHITIINQTRNKLGVMFGDPTTTPGGNVTKFQAMVRLQLWRGKAFQIDGVDVGHPVTVKAVKNKLAKPNKKGILRLDYETGWNNDWSMLSFAKDHDLLPEGARESAANLQKAHESVSALPEWFSGTA